jgi:hypothetical protein
VSSDFFTSIRHRVGGSRSVVERAILTRARQYKEGHPERPSKAKNIALNGLIRICREDTATDAQWLELFALLLYREETGFLAKRYRVVMRLGSLASFPRFEEWDYDSNFGPQGKQIDMEIARPIIQSVLFPRPLQDEGREWSKPWQYLTAACMEEGLKAEDVQKRVEVATQGITAEATQIKDEIVEEFRGQRRRGWFQAIHGASKGRGD